jgi:uncharacterized protein YbaA (DUF1428 family)
VARYVDGFLIPIRKKDIPAYKALAKKAARIWRELGALEYRECVGDDMVPHCGFPFPKAARTRPGETVVFSWIVYRSRAHRDRVNAKILQDPRIARMMEKTPVPFDVERMAYGGFKVLVEA